MNDERNGVSTTWKAIIVLIPVLAIVFYGGRIFGEQATRLYAIEKSMSSLLSVMDATLRSSEEIKERVTKLEWSITTRNDKS